MQKVIKYVMVIVAMAAAFVAYPKKAQFVDADVVKAEVEADKIVDADVVKAEKPTFNAAIVFMSLPASVLDVLDYDMRLDMVDYIEADSIRPTPNLVGSLSTFKVLTYDYADVQLTDISRLQLRLLPMKKGADIAVAAYTVGNAEEGIAPDTRLTFLDHNNNILDTKKYFKDPAVKDFFEIPKGSMTKMKEIEQMVGIPTFSYTLSPDNNTITARLTIEGNVDVDDYNILKLFLLPERVYDWNGSNYVLRKLK